MISFLDSSDVLRCREQRESLITVTRNDVSYATLRKTRRSLRRYSWITTWSTLRVSDDCRCVYSEEKERKTNTPGVYNKKISLVPSSSLLPAIGLSVLHAPLKSPPSSVMVVDRYSVGGSPRREKNRRAKFKNQLNVSYVNGYADGDAMMTRRRGSNANNVAPMNDIYEIPLNLF